MAVKANMQRDLWKMLNFVQVQGKRKYERWCFTSCKRRNFPPPLADL